MKRLFIFALLFAVLAFIPISTGTVAQPAQSKNHQYPYYKNYSNKVTPKPQPHVQNVKSQPAIHYPKPQQNTHYPKPQQSTHYPKPQQNTHYPKPQQNTHYPKPQSTIHNTKPRYPVRPSPNVHYPKPQSNNHYPNHNNLINSHGPQNQHHNHPYTPRPSPRPDIHHLNGPRPDIHHLNGPRPDIHHLNGPRPDIHHLNGPRPDTHHVNGPKPDIHNPHGPKSDSHDPKLHNHPKSDDHNKPKSEKPQSNAGPSNSGPGAQNNNQSGPQNNNQAGPQPQNDNQPPQNQPQDSANGSPCKVPATRQGIVAAAMWAASSGKYISYSQGGSRWSGITKKTCPYQGVPQVTDCSAFVTWLYWSAFGNGNDFVNGQGWKAGYTGTMGSHGKPVSLEQARPGDIVLYGSGTYDHATLYVGNNKVVSFGANGPAKLLNINYRSNYHIRSYLP